jgi:hypothetical protein
MKLCSCTLVSRTLNLEMLMPCDPFSSPSVAGPKNANVTNHRKTFAVLCYSTTAAVSSLHASRLRKDLTPYHAALSQQYSVASFATLRILNCLHSPRLRCSSCNGVLFRFDLEACNLVTAIIVIPIIKYCRRL